MRILKEWWLVSQEMHVMEVSMLTMFTLTLLDRCGNIPDPNYEPPTWTMRRLPDQIADDERNVDLEIVDFGSELHFLYELHGKTNYGFKELLTLWSKMIFLIDVKKNTMRFFLLQIIKGFFKVFLKNYIKYKKKDKIEVTEII